MLNPFNFQDLLFTYYISRRVQYTWHHLISINKMMFPWVSGGPIHIQLRREKDLSNDGTLPQKELYYLEWNGSGVFGNTMHHRFVFSFETSVHIIRYSFMIRLIVCGCEKCSQGASVWFGNSVAGGWKFVLDLVRLGLWCCSCLEFGSLLHRYSLSVRFAIHHVGSRL